MDLETRWKHFQTAAAARGLRIYPGLPRGLDQGVFWQGDPGSFEDFLELARAVGARIVYALAERWDPEGFLEDLVERPLPEDLQPQVKALEAEARARAGELAGFIAAWIHEGQVHVYTAETDWAADLRQRKEAMQTLEGGVEDYLRHTCEVLERNFHFLHERAPEVLEQIVDLLNEAFTKYLGLVLKHPARERESARRAMFYLINHALLPAGSAIWLNALSGNLPACFVEARFLLESLVKCYLADLNYSEKESFWERIRALEEEDRNISRWMREADKRLGLGKAFVELWRELSERWAHAGGAMRRILETVEAKGRPPSWSLIIPMEFVEEDLDSLQELGQVLGKLRRLLKAVMESYAQQLGAEGGQSSGLFA